MLYFNPAYTDKLVLGTVNAPYAAADDVDAAALALAVAGADFDSVPQLLDLFMNVEPELVIEFAHQHAISARQLAAALQKLKQDGWSPREKMEAAIEQLADAA